MYNIYPGAKVGRWTIGEKSIIDDKGQKRVLCKCDCGTERYVLEYTLRKGYSFSCGCVTREKLLKSRTFDLTGKVYGDLTVIGKSERQRSYGGTWWTCQCSCGNYIEYPTYKLRKGNRTSCGCKRVITPHNVKDISNQKFKRLTALYPTEKRTPQGHVIWHCRCECGNEIDASYGEIVYGARMSCGCQKLEHNAKVHDSLTFIAGTQVNLIKSKKLCKTNTSGVKGVYPAKGKWAAEIVFQQKKYHLGTYVKFEDAVNARKKAEDVLFSSTIEYYEKWKEKAETDPQWAVNNPIEITVVKLENGGLDISFLPQL